MSTSKRLLITLCMAGVLLSAVSRAAAQTKEDPLQDIKLTDAQRAQLKDLTMEFSRKEIQLGGEIASAVIDLAADLQREDRFTTEKQAAESAKTVNTLVKKISDTYGELFKNRVKYVLDAKDVLTPEQRVKVFAGLTDKVVEFPKKIVFDNNFDTLRKAVGLDLDQSRKILRYRTDMRVNELELQLKIDEASLDLEAELAKPKADSEEINKTVMKIADLVVKVLDNRVDHFLKEKDVLTVPQKEKLLQMIKAQ